MAITRVNYFPFFYDATWAVIFLVGFYFRNIFGLPIVILSAMLIDFMMISARGGHQDYYLSPSYFFVIPAYAALWYAGRFFTNNYNENLKGLLTFVGTALLGIIGCDLISSGGFYWMAADISPISFNDFINRTLELLPISIKTTMVYLSVAAITHFVFVLVGRSVNTQKTA